MLSHEFLENKILFTTPTFPYPTLPANDSLTDATGQRFTKGDEMFTLISHTHCYANHILAQNINTSSILLEYPRWDDFTAEVDKGYPLIGISSFPVHLDNVIKMCKYIRKHSPASKIMLGSYAAMAFQASFDKAEQKKLVDHVVIGEGVTFLRKLLREENIDRPVKQTLMPKAGGSPPFVNKFPTGSVGFLVSGLGCVGGCDFCSTTTMFDKKRIQLLSPDELVHNMQLYYKHFPEVSQVFVIEEDHFRFPEYLIKMKEYWEEYPQVLEQIDWFGFGSIDHIGKFAKLYGWQALAEIGLGTLFIGVESKFAGEHGYDKRTEFDAKEVFSRLHSVGIRSVGAWICGWDWHDHSNIYEDLNYFISLYPTYQQLTRMSPFPGTALWKKLKKEDRISEVPWEDVHFWSGAQKNINLEPHETLNLTEYGYDLLYKTWGPSLLRRLDVQLNGYAFCAQSDNHILRKHRIKFFKKQNALLWTLLRGMDRYAPNGVVRRRCRKVDEKYRKYIGEPTAIMKTLAKTIEGMATIAKIVDFVNPIHKDPKEEPYKRYIYDKNENSGNAVPYKTQWPKKPDYMTKASMIQSELQTKFLAKVLSGVQYLNKKTSDPMIDDYIINLLGKGGFGFGF
ncbi:radical SAM domain-containing protein [Candidatus Magnetomorum sp. HK-1]|nr:radical SAM domain-containing protein [Candidatus Magnetomorum sp. HK-1]